MTKAEQRATELGYHNDPWNRAEYTANDVKQACIEGYQQAEKDVIDAFIEKAAEWMEHNVVDYLSDTGVGIVFDKWNGIEEFKKAMKLWKK